MCISFVFWLCHREPSHCPRTLVGTFSHFQENCWVKRYTHFADMCAKFPSRIVLWECIILPIVCENAIFFTCHHKDIPGPSNYWL